MLVPAIPLEELRTSRGEDEKPPVQLVEDPPEQVEERLLGPVEILEEHDDRLLPAQSIEEAHPRRFETVPRDERVQVRRGVEAEGETQDLSILELREK